ncbi:MAG: tetratricopeptide repeat protein, partial [Anaerolineales bacterium]
MRLTGERLRLSDSRGRSNPWRILALLALIGVGVLLLWLRDRGQVQPLFLATPTATRSATTYHQEAQAHFIAGDLDKAISAYGNAVEVDPQNADLWAELARVQTYSSDLLTTLRDRQARLNEARQSIDNAVEVDPENSFAYAIRALVYDWSASAEVRDPIGVGDNVYVIATLGDDGRLAANMIELADLAALSESEATPEGERAISFSGIIEASGEDEWVVSGRSLQISPFTEIREGNRRESFLTEARLSATKARQLDQTNSLALALLAEVLVDQQNVAQAADLAQTAVERATEAGANDPYLMDIYRVNGTVLEHQGLYLRAIEEYKKATHINPNLTFLYLKIGANYRTLRDIDSALDNFA